MSANTSRRRLTKTHKASIAGVATLGAAALAFSLVPGNAAAEVEPQALANTQQAAWAYNADSTQAKALHSSLTDQHTALGLKAKQQAEAAAKAKANAVAAAKAKADAAEKKARESATRCEIMVTGYHITATFGQGGSRWAHNHTGLDFAAPMGTPIHSVMKGVVIFADWAGPYGRQVQVRHEDGTVTWYNHMSKFSVSVGETVYAGDQVGAIGMTGNTTGPHLHFEVHPDGGSAVDPDPWLRNHCGLNPYTAG